MRRAALLFLVVFLAAAPALHVHDAVTDHDHLLSCPVASLRSAETGASPSAAPAPASPTPAPEPIAAAPRLLAAREIPSPRGPPASLV